MSRLLTLAAVSSLLVPLACGRPAPIAAGEVGTFCPAPMGTHGDGRVTLSRLLFGNPNGTGDALSWIEVARRDQLKLSSSAADDPGVREVRLVSPRHIGGSPGPSAAVTLRARAVEEALSELDRGSSIVVVYSASTLRPQAPLTLLVSSVRADGSVVFLGECARDSLTTTYDAFVSARQGRGDSRSAATLFYALADDAALRAELRALDTAAPASARWDDRAPERRLIDPDGATPPPAAVMAGLRSHLVHFAYPAAWKAFDASVATFVPGVGWNPAVPFATESADPAVPAYASLTAGFEVWAIGAPGDISRPLVKLGTVDAATIAARDDIHLTARGSATSLDALVEQARRGTAGFALAR
ncbi:MAG TPA: hypothetical protein VF519_00975 [Mycobacteriales bacterium]|jgi:hypothetical protein